MKIAVLTMCIGSNYAKTWESARLSKEMYCQRHDYTFIFVGESLDKDRVANWSKIIALQNELSQYDWIFYSDADAHIMNFDIKLEDIIAEYSQPDKFLIITKDNNEINSGNFIIKNDPISHEFLADAYTHFPTKPVSLGENKGYGIWNDQYGIYHEYRNEKYASRVSIIPQNIINAYPCACCGIKYKTGDLLIHFVNSRRPTHNWTGLADEPWKCIEIAEAKTNLLMAYREIHKLRNMLQNK